MEKIKTIAAVLFLGVVFMAVERITYELVFLLLLLLLLPSCETWNELVYGHKHATGPGTSPVAIDWHGYNMMKLRQSYHYKGP